MAEILQSQTFEYYMNALLNLYDPVNPQTWKSVCLKCNMARPLKSSITCCFYSYYNLQFLFGTTVHGFGVVDSLSILAFLSVSTTW